MGPRHYITLWGPGCSPTQPRGSNLQVWEHQNAYNLPWPQLRTEFKSIDSKRSKPTLWQQQKDVNCFPGVAEHHLVLEQVIQNHGLLSRQTNCAPVRTHDLNEKLELSLKNEGLKYPQRGRRSFQQPKKSRSPRISCDLVFKSPGTGRALTQQKSSFPLNLAYTTPF